MGEEVYEGIVKKFYATKGFIHRGDPYSCIGLLCPSCVFVHYTGINPIHSHKNEVGHVFLQVGDRVRFRIQPGLRGGNSIQACDVRVVGK